MKQWEKELLLACKSDMTLVVEQKQKTGYDILFADNLALRTSAKYGSLSVGKCLLENGADVSDRHYESIILAAKHGHLEFLELLFTYMPISKTPKPVILRAINEASISKFKYIVDYLVDIVLCHNK